MARRESKRQKTIDSGHVPPPRNLTNAWTGDQAKEWIDSADKEMDGLTDSDVVEHNMTEQDLIDAGVPVDPTTGKIKGIPLSVVLDHKYMWMVS